MSEALRKIEDLRNERTLKQQLQDDFVSAPDDSEPELTGLEYRVHGAVEKHQPATCAMLATALELTPNTIRNVLGNLAMKGLIVPHPYRNNASQWTLVDYSGELIRLPGRRNKFSKPVTFTGIDWREISAQSRKAQDRGILAGIADYAEATNAPKEIIDCLRRAAERT